MNNLFLASCAEGGSPLIWIPVLVIIFGMLIWSSISNKKRAKEAQNMVNTLKKGDRVKTIGGICGFVVEIYDAENTFVLETGTGENKSYIKFDKAAIYQTAPKEGYANPKPKEETEVKIEETVEKTETTKPEETVEKTEVKVEEKPKKKGKKSSKEVVVETPEEVTEVKVEETAEVVEEKPIEEVSTDKE